MGDPLFDSSQRLRLALGEIFVWRTGWMSYLRLKGRKSERTGQ
jgi:hypothetical protein